MSVTASAGRSWPLRWGQRGRQGDAWLRSNSKRGVDLALGTVGVVAATPVALAAGVVVLLTLGRPITVKQPRAGRGGFPIVVRKLRTMTDVRNSAEELLPDADRLSTVGRALRSWSIDELPQLLSVVKGDMSIIGPRPLPLAYTDRYDSRQRLRLEARPGLTGWAQVNGRNALSWPSKLELDAWYVEHASWRLDLAILMMTVRTMLSRRGVSADGHVTMPEFTGEE